MCYWTLLSSRMLVGVYLLWLVAYPPARASALSLRLLCLYVVGMLLSLTWMNEAYHRGQAETARILGWVIAGYSALLPLSVWHVLRADTEYWRGIGKRAVELQDTFRRKSGKIEERVSSQGFHVLIEMHRKYIIDFARLAIYEPVTIVGHNERNKSVVYRGFLYTKKTPVAIKVYMPTDFTEETVAAFSHEAALCGALVHPNILKFHGLCVCPPNICLVTELCQASLQDIKDTQAAQTRQGHASPLRREQTLIDIGYMIDAARAIAYLHSFSPPFVHRDIKPSSFLLDNDGTAKLTDFGASRPLSVRSVGMSSTTTNLSRPSLGGRTVLEMPANLPKNGAQYMAPEVIRASQAGTVYFGEAADVYSLAVTMWDILHPGRTKYSSHHGRTSLLVQSSAALSDAELFERVLSGERPPLDSIGHLGLRELIHTAWHDDARLRPSARTIVASLEAIQEELCAVFALELMEGLGVKPRSELPTSISVAEPQPFAGTQAVERLRVWDSVGSQSEAIRLGNMLMDCGFVHHTKHARCFEYTSSQYMFDATQVLACQPLALLEADHDEAAQTSNVCLVQSLKNARSERRSLDSPTGEHAGGRARSGSHQSSHVIMEARCSCRKLGQRLESERSTQSRFRFKFKIFSDENQLTARLLTDDQPNWFGMSQYEAIREPSRQERWGRKGTADPSVEIV